MKRERTIAVILPTALEYANRLYQGAVRYVEEHRNIALRDMSYSRRGRSPLPRGPLRFDAALTWLNECDTWVERLLKEGIAVVTASDDWRGRQVPVIAFDGTAIVDLAVDHLASLHRPHAVYVGVDTEGNPVTERRRRRFLELMTKRGISCTCCELGAEELTAQRGRPARSSTRNFVRLQRFLRKQALPAVAWCESDYTGLFVCETARDFGLRVPHDLAVLGCGDFREAHFCRPALSTIAQPGDVVGYEALAAIDRILDGQAPAHPRIAIPPPPVIWRESTGGGNLDDDVILRARRLIDSQACHGLRVKDLMDSFLMSQPTFTKRFREVVGRTPGEEIRRVRLDRAKDYLKDGRLTIARVAGLCGYSEQNKFTNFFKRETGMSPSRFRRSSPCRNDSDQS